MTQHSHNLTWFPGLGAKILALTRICSTFWLPGMLCAKPILDVGTKKGERGGRGLIPKLSDHERICLGKLAQKWNQASTASGRNLRMRCFYMTPNHILPSPKA